jgi:imidazolonepropionase-like amidohydrolase
MNGRSLNLVGVQILAPTFDRFVEDAELSVRDGRILYAGPRDMAPDLPREESVDLEGCYLIPGLFDLHVHIDEKAIANQLRLFLRYGVTGVRDMGSNADETAKLVRGVASGLRLGPRILSFGELVDGPNPFWPEISVVPSSSEEIEAHVRRIREMGLPGVKFYFRLPADKLSHGIETCAAQDLLTAGHVGSAVKVSEALSMGITSIEHVSTLTRDLVEEKEFPSDAGFQSVFRLWRNTIRPESELAQRLIDTFTRSHAIWVPTLAVYEAIVNGDSPRITANPHLDELQGPLVEQWPTMAYTKEWTSKDYSVAREAFEVMKEFVRTFWQQGGRLGVGSDTPNPYVLPGLSLLREVRLLSDLGIPETDVLRQCCQEPARYFGEESKWGNLEAGKQADFVVLEGNPLADISAIDRPRAVVVQGTMYAPDDLLSPVASAGDSTAQPYDAGGANADAAN